MKKILSLTLLALATFGISATASADEIEPTSATLTLAQEQKVDAYINNNLDSILRIAKESNSAVQGEATLASDDGTVYHLPTYIVDTTQLAREMTNNETVQSQVAIVDTADATDATRAAGNKGSTLWDSTSSVKSSSTIYYDQTQSGSIRNYKLTSFSGSYSIQQSGVSVSTIDLAYGCSDSLKGQNGTKYPSGSSYSYSTGFSKYASPQNGQFACGITHRMRISRGSTWNFTHQNNI